MTGDPEVELVEELELDILGGCHTSMEMLFCTSACMFAFLFVVCCLFCVCIYTAFGLGTFVFEGG